MSLTREDVIRIANLARLALTDEELAHYGEQLSAILEYATRLEELDLSSAPSARGARQNILREDVVEPSLPPEDALFNAAAALNGHFLIQPVLEE
jgi:aspartyl-tRNA(Asn)/glutamyl-tRNA(Gln) amidotransferase subunit C